MIRFRAGREMSGDRIAGQFDVRMETTTTTTTTLAYGAPLSWRQRRGVRVAAVAVLTCALVACAYVWGPAAWERATLVLAQRRCSSGVMPADVVAFEEDPARAAALRDSNSAYTRGQGSLTGAALFSTPSALLRYPPGRLLSNMPGRLNAVNT